MMVQAGGARRRRNYIYECFAWLVIRHHRKCTGPRAGAGLVKLSGRRVVFGFNRAQASPRRRCEETSMFIAMNRFKVKKGSEESFERVWLERDSYLEGVPGFVEFHLLKGPEAEDHTLYASHTVWRSKAAFEAWTRSEEFRRAHARAGNQSTGPLYLEHPKFEGFEIKQTVLPAKSVA
jgi:heme-degrading monooxygenase HmoA